MQIINSISNSMKISVSFSFDYIILLSRSFPECTTNWSLFPSCHTQQHIKRYTQNRNHLVQWSNCGTMEGIHSVGVCVGEHQSEDSFVSFSAKPTERPCAWDFLRWRGRARSQYSQQRGVSEPGKGDGQSEAAAEASIWNLWTEKPGHPANARG